jgi:hypothetical protein
MKVARSRSALMPALVAALSHQGADAAYHAHVEHDRVLGHPVPRTAHVVVYLLCKDRPTAVAVRRKSGWGWESVERSTSPYRLLVGRYYLWLPEDPEVPPRSSRRVIAEVLSGLRGVRI